MGQKWLILGLLIAFTGIDFTQAKSNPAIHPVVTTPQTAVTKAPTAQTPTSTEQAKIKVESRCDAAPWRYLVGRTMSDLLTVKLPLQSRIYRVGDPITIAVVPNRLQVEVNRGTRVSRVYCS